MLISPKYKIGFIHTPRTGGASMKQALMNMDDKAHRVGIYHQPLTKAMCDDYSHYIKFATVRNSWALIVSFYRYFVERKKVNISFNDYVRGRLLKRGLHFPYQLGYLGKPQGVMVDRVLHFENLNKDFKKLCVEVGAPYDLNTRIHSTGSYVYQTYYDESLKNFVYELCKEDIKYFGFTFGGKH